MQASGPHAYGAGCTRLQASWPHASRAGCTGLQASGSIAGAGAGAGAGANTGRCFVVVVVEFHAEDMA